MTGKDKLIDDCASYIRTDTLIRMMAEEGLYWTHDEIKTIIERTEVSPFSLDEVKFMEHVLQSGCLGDIDERKKIARQFDGLLFYKEG